MYRTTSDLGDLHGRRVLVRLDLNVPMDGARIRDESRVALAAPTVIALRRAGARVIAVSHLGEGGPKETLAPIARSLAAHLGAPVAFLRDRVGTAALARRVAALAPGAVALLENIRRYTGERENGARFAQQLASLADVYVNDSFGVVHRAHASVAAVAALLPSAAGPLLLREIAALDRLTDDPAPPFVVLLGGAKVSTKTAFLARLLARADSVLIGGAMAVAFFAARGYGIGDSLLESDAIASATRILRNYRRKNLTLPLDVIIGNARAGHRGTARVVTIAATPHPLCGAGEAILDIGPRTIRAFAEQLRSARTMVWNGPMGRFERPPFHHGSIALARCIAARSSGRAYGVVGGGETVAVLAATGMARYVDHTSSGGGAMLAYLAGEKLPGLIALRARASAHRRLSSDPYRTRSGGL